MRYPIRAGTSGQSKSLYVGWHYEIEGQTYHFYLSAILLFKNGDDRIKLPSIADVVLHWFLYSCDPPEKAALAVWGGAGERAQRTAPEEAASRDHGSVKHTQKELGVWENVAPTMPGAAGEAAELIQGGKERYSDAWVLRCKHHQTHDEFAIFSLLLFGRLTCEPELGLTCVSTQEYQSTRLFLFNHDANLISARQRVTHARGASTLPVINPTWLRKAATAWFQKHFHFFDFIRLKPHGPKPFMVK